MNKRILVTGGAGFLGSHLVERLAGQGHHVIVLDNFFTGAIENLSTVAGRLQIIDRDVCEPWHYEVDEIYHLACPASPVHYQRNPARTIRTCVEGTLRALECARDTGARVLIASTSEIYGDPAEHPQTEAYRGNCSTVGPRACYDEGKRCAESLVTSYVRQHKIEARIARIFNCYGPRMHENDGRVVSSFISQALRGRPLTIFGDGRQTRSFIYVDDLIGGLERLMRAQGRVPTGDGYGDINGLPVNLGNPIETTVRELADIVIGMVGRGEVTRLPLPEDDPTRRKPDITRAQRALGWAPIVTLQEGLRQTVEWFRQTIRV